MKNEKNTYISFVCYCTNIWLFNSTTKSMYRRSKDMPRWKCCWKNWSKLWICSVFGLRLIVWLVICLWYSYNQANILMKYCFFLEQLLWKNEEVRFLPHRKSEVFPIPLRRDKSDVEPPPCGVPASYLFCFL